MQLKRELVRKDKALAEAAALLVLQKKFRALWDGIQFAGGFADAMIHAS